MDSFFFYFYQMNKEIDLNILDLILNNLDYMAALHSDLYLFLYYDELHLILSEVLELSHHDKNTYYLNGYSFHGCYHHCYHCYYLLPFFLNFLNFV